MRHEDDHMLQEPVLSQTNRNIEIFKQVFFRKNQIGVGKTD
jgi:hypothetical protein